MIILGIDPGLNVTGWGVIEITGNSLGFRACGTVRTAPAQPLGVRLASIHSALSAIIGQWTPHSAAIEETFVNKNPASALKLGQARGVALSVPALHGLDVTEYAANTVKKSVVGAGHAAKEQISVMVRMLLPGCGAIGPDEADALAVAICHAHHGNTQQKILRSLVRA